MVLLNRIREFIVKKRSALQLSEASLPKSVYELYGDCSEIPLYAWVKVACTGKLAYLVKSGACWDEAALTERYAELVTEYGTLVKDAKTTQELKLKIALTQLANKIDQVNIAVHTLRTFGWNEDVVRILRAPVPVGLGFTRLSYAPEKLEADLKFTETFLQMDIVRFKQRSVDMETLLKKAGGGVNSEAEFYGEITMLSKWLGFGIHPKETSLLQYVGYLNMLKAEIKNNEK